MDSECSRETEAALQCALHTDDRPIAEETLRTKEQHRKQDSVNDDLNGCSVPVERNELFRDADDQAAYEWTGSKKKYHLVSVASCQCPIFAGG